MQDIHLKLIAQLSPTVYKLQIAASEFRLNTAENYFMRTSSRRLDIVTMESLGLVSTMLRKYKIEDGFYVKLIRHSGYCVVYSLNRMDKELLHRVKSGGRI